MVTAVMSTTADKKVHRPIVNQQVLLMRAKGFIKPQEAAKKAGISLPRIYALMDEQKIEGAKVGSRRYVSLASLKKYFGPALMGNA